jgi:hypothetical protein
MLKVKPGKPLKEEPKIQVGDIVKMANIIMTGKVTYSYINGTGR